MSQFRPVVEPATVWLMGLIEAIDEVAASSEKPAAAYRAALANRLELPALPAPFGTSPPSVGRWARADVGRHG